MTFIKDKLPIWMNGDNAKALQGIIENWWEQVGLWCRLPAMSFDVLTCDMNFVDLLAFQRGIDRYPGEAEWFYRLRVHHALRNARVAGTQLGMDQIFTNLQLPIPEYFERLPEFDWDVTKVIFGGRAFARLHTEINFALDYYWRTCRRYNVYQKVEAVTHFGPAMLGYNRARGVKHSDPESVPFRPAATTLGVGATMTKRATGVTRSQPEAVPFRQSISRMSCGFFGFCRSANTRSFAL